jgi:hypothetical protein
MTIERGVDAITALLERRLHDVRAISDVAAFRAWLDLHRTHWERDDVFTRRRAVRDIRRAHPEIGRLEHAYRDAVASSEATPEGARLKRLEHECASAKKGIAGIALAIETGEGDQRVRLEEKLERYRERVQMLDAERQGILLSCDECRRARETHRRLEELREESGLREAEEALAGVLLARGQRSGRAGERFEETARACVETVIAPEVARGGDARVLHGVRLGGARVELDAVVVRVSAIDGDAVEVLAIVEAKRNVNDLAHGAALRRENIAWLTGDASGYEAERYRTRVYTSGHFDTPAMHDGLRFDRSSFARFMAPRCEQPLYFITRSGPLWGLHSAALARVAHRVATDERWNPSSDDAMLRLLAWTHGLASDHESPDLLADYRCNPDCAERLLVLP